MIEITRITERRDEKNIERKTHDKVKSRRRMESVRERTDERSSLAVSFSVSCLVFGFFGQRVFYLHSWLWNLLFAYERFDVSRLITRS